MPPPPRALRVLQLPDRLVLHDVTASLRHADPSDRNALIDAANLVHSRYLSASSAITSELPTPSLLDLDLPTPPAGANAPGEKPPERDRYLVLPFDAENVPPAYVASSPEQAGVSVTLASSLVVDAAAGLLGILRLPSARYAVLATQARRAGSLPASNIYSVSRVKLVRLSANPPLRNDKELTTAIAKTLDGGALYFALDTDLTRCTQARASHGVANAFWWTWPLAERLGSQGWGWSLRTVYGFVGTHVMRFQSTALASGSGEFNLTIVSRRSRRRAGTRYITRGVDAMGDVANFVETEQVAWAEERPTIYSSFVIIRGSVPVFWRQDNGIARPAPELDGVLTASRKAFRTHFDEITRSYGGVSAVSLVDKKGSEGVLADAFERHFDLDLRDLDVPLPPKLVAFDFHTHCAGKEYERGLGKLLERLRQDVEVYGIFARGLEATGKNSTQHGVFRVNCVDCLDRTNVVQSLLSRVVLNMQLEAIFSPELLGAEASAMPRVYGESEDRFKHVWGDNADAVSKQYSGTGALKTDFTRTGKRSTTGLIGDGMKSVMRMYYKNFVDEGRQEVIDILCGNALIRPRRVLADARGSPTESVTPWSGSPDDVDPVSSPLWYSFEALRVNASGDKQPVFIELHDDAMFITTAEGIALEYPRHSLVSWSKYEDGKTTEKKTPIRLRLIYKPLRRAPATASPLDLQFKTGPVARETFLRALISWAQPEILPVFSKTHMNVRVIAGLNAGEHKMKDWGLPNGSSAEKNEIIALVLPEGNTLTRSWGLAAVPIDVDSSGYVLVGACSVTDRGPAIAVLVSENLAPAVMSVAQAISGRSAAFSPGGAAAVGMHVAGTSLCFVSGHLSGSTDVYHSLSALKLGRHSFDVTNQFHHFALAGLLGDMHWHHGSAPGSGPEARNWVHLGDGSSCYSLANGLSVMRNSFPTLRYDDRIAPNSLWRVEHSPRRTGSSIACVELASGLIDGRPGPMLPKSVSQCIISLSELQGENIKTPPGIDQNSQLNSQIVLYCEHSATEGIVSRQTPRPSQFPRWNETLRLVLMPVDAAVVYKSFVVGQIITPTPLSDAVPAGHFVIPISGAQRGRAKFDVPCRLAGIPTGRLSGIMEVHIGGPELLNTASQTRSTVPSSGLAQDASKASRSALPPIPAPRSGDASFAQSDPRGLTRHGKSSSSFSSLPKKPSIDEVNRNLDAARRKGSKQIKSVVNKLSSLLSQPTSSNSSSSRNSRQGYDETIGTDNPPRTEGFREVNEELGDMPSSFRKESQARMPMTRGTSEPRLQSPQITASLSNRRVVSYQGAPSDAGSGQAGEKTSGDDFSSFGSFQAALPSAPKRLPLKLHPALSEDPLLVGLKSGMGQGLKATPASRKVPVHAQNTGGDLLLSGLAGEKAKLHNAASASTADDDWSDFKAADSTNDSSIARSVNTNSLLDL